MDKLCRLCLSEENILSDLYDSSQKILSRTLVECIEYISDLKILENDHLPNEICHKCIYLVEQCYQFVKTIERSNQILCSLEFEGTDVIATKTFTSERVEFDDWNVEILEDDDNNSTDGNPREKDNGNCDKKTKETDALTTKVKTKQSGFIEVKKEEKCDSEQIKCQFCAKTFTTKRSLSTHEKRHTEGPRFECKMCSKKFFLQYELKRHELNHMPVTEKPFKCDKCPKSFAIHSELRRHYLYHTNVRHYKCSLCGKSFIESGHLTNHLNSVHLDSKRFQCTFCEKKFISAFKLKQHQKGQAFCKNRLNIDSSIQNTTLINEGNEMISEHVDDPDDVDLGLSDFLHTQDQLEIDIPAVATNLDEFKLNHKSIQIFGIKNERDEIEDYIFLADEIESDTNIQTNENEITEEVMQCDGTGVHEPIRQMINTVDDFTHPNNELIVDYVLDDNDIHFVNWDKEILA